MFLPPKKTSWMERRQSDRHAVSRADLMRRGGPDVIQCLLFSGAAVGVDEEALNSVGVMTAFMLDNDWEKLGAFGHRVFFSVEEMVRAIPEWDFVLDGPMRLCASFQSGYKIDYVAYWEENQKGQRVRTLKGCWDNGESLPRGNPLRRENDYVQMLKALHSRFPKSRVTTVFSTPCRVFSQANSTKSAEKADSDMSHRQTYLKKTCLVMKRAVFAVEYLQRLGVQASLWAECSLNEEQADAICEAMNSVDKRKYTWRKVHAEHYGSPSDRVRVVFASFALFDYLPAARPDFVRGWGSVLSVCKSSKLRLQGGSWRRKTFSGRFASETASAATTMPYSLYIERDDEDEVHLIAATPRQKALLMGVCPLDPRLKALDAIPNALGNTLVGIGFSAQWFLAVTFGNLGAMRLMGSPENTSRSYWGMESLRKQRHPPRVPGSCKYSLQKEVKLKIKLRELQWQSSSFSSKKSKKSKKRKRTAREALS